MLIWKIELDVLAMFRSELCGIQLNKMSGGGRREFPRGLQGAVMSEVLLDQIKMSCSVRMPR